MSIDQQFDRFHARNPEILQQLINLAREAKARGYKSYSLKALWEVLRFNSDPKSHGKYKLSNNYTSRYSRLVMETAPDLRGFFSLRDLTSADAVAKPPTQEAHDHYLDELLGVVGSDYTPCLADDNEPEYDYADESEEDAA